MVPWSARYVRFSLAPASPLAFRHSKPKGFLGGFSPSPLPLLFLLLLSKKFCKSSAREREREGDHADRFHPYVSPRSFLQGRRNWLFSDFKYKSGEDSILLVSREAYQICDTTNPVNSITHGNTNIQLPHSGPLYFISGGNEKRQKLLVYVLSDRSLMPSSQSPPPASCHSDPTSQRQGSKPSTSRPLIEPITRRSPIGVGRMPNLAYCTI